MQQANAISQSWSSEPVADLVPTRVISPDFDGGITASTSTSQYPARCDKAEYLTPNCVVFTYYQGSVGEEVERHFNRSLSIPSSFCSAVAFSKETEKLVSEENNYTSLCCDYKLDQNAAEILPMSHRNLPASFWRPETSQQRARLPFAQNVQTRKYVTAQSCPQSRVVTIQRFPQVYGQVPYGQPIWVQQPQPSVYSHQPIIPMTAVPSYPPSVGNRSVSTGIQVPENPVPGSMILEEPTVGHGFNPRFNSLLVHPTIKPGLPAVPGQPDLSRVEWKEVFNIQQMAPGLPRHGEKSFFLV